MFASAIQRAHPLQGDRSASCDTELSVSVWSVQTQMRMPVVCQRANGVMLRILLLCRTRCVLDMYFVNCQATKSWVPPGEDGDGSVSQEEFERALQPGQGSKHITMNLNREPPRQ